MDELDNNCLLNSEVTRLVNKSVILMEELTKLWLFSYNDNCDKWIIHSRELLHYTNKVTRNNYLSNEEIFFYTYEINEDKIPKILSEYVEEFEQGTYTGYMRSDHEHINKLTSGLRHYFEKLSIVLSEEGYVTTSEIRDILRGSGLRDVPAYDMDDVIKNNWLPCQSK